MEEPENSLLAYERAMSAGFGIECDVRMTGDHQIIMSHDANTKRLSGIDKDIKETPLEELRKLRLSNHPRGSKLTFATFEKVCGLIRDRLPEEQKAAIHLKGEEQTPEMLQTLQEFFRRFQLHQKAFIFDTTLATAKTLKALDPQIESAISIGEEKYSPTIYTWDEVKKHLLDFDHVWWDEWKISGSVYNEQMAREIHTTGKHIYVISPELHKDHGHPQSENGYEELWKRCIKWNVEGMCTAYPQKFQALYREIKGKLQENHHIR